MSYSFNEHMNWYNYIYWFLADDSFVKYYWYNKQITHFEWGHTWDYINIANRREYSFKPNKLYFDISQVGDNWWAWYKLKIPLFWQGWTYYKPTTIIDAVIISDGTNWFTQSGIIEFEMDERYWNYWNLNWKSKWYSWQIILENLWDTITPMIADIRQIEYSAYIVNEWINTDKLNFEKIHNYLQTVNPALSTKNKNQYFFDCWIQIVWWHFKSVSEQITFWRNFDINIKSENIQYWELEKWKAINWCSIKFSCYNGDFWWKFWDTKSKIYSLDYETIYETWSRYKHWHWGANLWWGAFQDINGLTINRMRSVSMSPTDNVVLNPRIINTHIEPIWAIIDWWITIKYDQAIRTNGSFPQYVHNFDLTWARYRHIQNRATWKYKNAVNYFVDCKWTEWFQKVSWQIQSSWAYKETQYTYTTFSMIVKTIDKVWTPIENVTVKLYNKDDEVVFDWTTNVDWYANELNWTVTRAELDYVEDTNANFPVYTNNAQATTNWLFYREFMMTSWINKTIRKIIKKNNTWTLLYNHTPFINNNSVWDNFIIVPYVNAIRNRANLDDSAYYKSNIEEKQWPFTLEIKKWDYKYSELLEIDRPINKTIVLEKKQKSVNIDLENIN